MREVIRILYLPTGEYVTSANRVRSTGAVLFADKASAELLVNCLIEHKPYINGAPISDYTVGSLPSSLDFFKEEFEYVSTPIMSFEIASSKVITLSNEV